MPPKHDFIPQSDLEFKNWQAQFIEYALAHAGALGLDAGQQAAIAAGRTEWEAKLAAHFAAHDAGRAATKDKNKARNDHKKLLRTIAARIRSNTSVTAGQLEGLNMTVPDNVRTRLDPELVIRKTPAPVLAARSEQLGQVTLRWLPRRRPFGMRGIRVWVADVTEAGKPVYRYVGDAARQPYIHKVGNKHTVTLEYKVRWFDRLLRDGPFGDPVTVAVGSGIAGKKKA